ncbi:unnamed protein product, partial [Medioppia subpectinata]
IYHEKVIYLRISSKENVLSFTTTTGLNIGVLNSQSLQKYIYLIAFAEERAEELRRTNVFEHRKGGDYGECLFKTTKSSPKKMSELKCKTAAKHWYDEIEFYDFERGVAKAGHESEQIGHFTQMVWSDTLEIGCAKSFSDSTGITYLVCNYYPHGNVQGTFPKNVPKLRSFFNKTLSYYVIVYIVLIAFGLVGAIIGIIFGLNLTSTDSTFNDKCIKYHNKYRKRHLDTPALSISQEFSFPTSQPARLEDSGTNTTSGVYGVSIWYAPTTQAMDKWMYFTCFETIQAWYSEQEYYIYNYASPVITFTKHFTQMVWKSTREVGCAKSYSATNFYVVCHYFPKGNIKDQYNDNIMSKQLSFANNVLITDTIIIHMKIGSKDTPNKSSTVSGNPLANGPNVTASGMSGLNTTTIGTTSAHMKARPTTGAANAAKPTPLPLVATTTQRNDNVTKEDEDYTNKCLALHNQYRALHRNTPPMKANMTLMKSAKHYANHCAAQNKIKHSYGLGLGWKYGENLWAAYSSGPVLPLYKKDVCKDAVKTWYGEAKHHNYNYKTGPLTAKDVENTGHFTQFMWTVSTHLGCAKSVNEKGRNLIVVCHYYEAVGSY